jgi:TPR repeat protein
MYENGMGVPRDWNLALVWFRRSQQNGDKDAAGRIARIQQAQQAQRARAAKQP